MTRSIVSVNAETTDRRPDVQASWMARGWRVVATEGRFRGASAKRQQTPRRSVLPAIEPVTA